jgi:superfamily II DNA helicase RecQ
LTSTNFVITTTTDYWTAVVFFEPKKQVKLQETEIELSQKEIEIFDALKIWRNDLANKLGWSAFMVCHNSHLIAIAKEKPDTIELLQKIKGFGVNKSEKYGDDIIALLNTF